MTTISRYLKPLARRSAWTWMLFAAGTLALGACKNDAKPAPGAQSGAAEEGGAHEGHGHEESGHEGHDHGAHEHGPHEGEIIELGGGKFHAELLHDHDTHTTTVYVLGEDVKTASPIEAQELTVNVVVDGKPQQFKLPAVPESSDPAGKSSKFELADEALCTALDTEGAKARLSAQVGGQALTGDVPEHGHEGDEGHKH